MTEDSIDADKETLCDLLNGCLAAGVSPTNIKVRTAILDTAPVLLEGLPKYAKFLDAVNTERTKRSLEAVEIAPPQGKGGRRRLQPHGAFARGLHSEKRQSSCSAGKAVPRWPRT